MVGLAKLPPGKDVSSAPSDKISPLPRKEIAIISVLLVGTGAFYSSLNVLLVYMVQSYEVAANPGEIGRYTGWMSASYFLGQLCTSLFWGWLSDRTGRKPWLITAELVACCCALTLAFCQDYYVACTILFVFGFFHGTVVVAKSTIAELCDKTNQSLAFGIVLVTIGVGATFGPLIGGLLAEPCKKGLIKNCSPFLASHPFLIPFLIFATMNITSATCTIFLRETNPLGTRTMRRLVPVADEESLVLKSVASGKLNPAVKYKQDLEEGGSKRMQAGTEDGAPNDGQPTLTSPLLRKTAASESSSPTRDVILVTVLFGLVYFVYLYGDTLFAVFAATPVASNGLGYDSSIMGIVGCLYGLTMALFTLFGFPGINRALGPIRCVQLCFLVYIVWWPFGPVTAYLAGRPVVKFLAVLLFKMVRVVCGCTGATAAMMLVSNAASSANQGFVAGLSTTAGSLLGSIAPAAAGVLWALFGAMSFPLHQFMPWLVPSLAGILGITVCCFISPRINTPRSEAPES